jgi:hypothetical protein
MKIFNPSETVFETIGNYKFEIARAGNLAFRDKLKRLGKSRKKEIDKGLLSAKDSDNLIAKAMSGTILVGWKMTASTHKNEVEVLFTVDECEKTLIEDDILRDRISEIASDEDVYLTDLELYTEKKQ